MPFEIIRDDIVKMKVDAIVNPTNSLPEVGYGVDWLVHKAAGKRLLKERSALGSIAVGDCGITKGCRLNAKYVIHAVGPVWRGGDKGEVRLQRACYDKALALAKEKGCESIAFPLMGAGNKGFTRALAMKIAREAVRDFLEHTDMQVYLVMFRGEDESEKTHFWEIEHYLHDREDYLRMLEAYGVDEQNVQNMSTEQLRTLIQRLRNVRSEYLLQQAEALERIERERERLLSMPVNSAMPCEDRAEPEFRPRPMAAPMAMGNVRREAKSAPSKSLEDILRTADESFSQTLLRLIDGSGKKDSEIYKKANVDRKLFSKIRTNPDYKPGKTTALAFALALELDMDATQDLLRRAGFALSHSSKFDLIIEYFIRQRLYDVFVINEVLFEYDQPLIGG